MTAMLDFYCADVFISVETPVVLDASTEPLHHVLLGCHNIGKLPFEGCWMMAPLVSWSIVI